MNTYGRLTTTTEPVKVKKYKYVNATCTCGNVKTYRLDSLTSGNTKSCGCLHSEIVRKSNAKG